MQTSGRAQGRGKAKALPRSARSDAGKFRPRKFTLRDGREVIVRAIAPSDAPRIVQAFEHLSSEARYLRFGEHKKELSGECVERGTHPVTGSEFGIVATAPSGPDVEIVGLAHYVAAQQPGVCEFAVTVADAWTHCGLATRLLRSLLRRAKRDGFQAIEALIVANNEAMLALARRLRFAIAPAPQDATVYVARRVL